MAGDASVGRKGGRSGRGDGASRQATRASRGGEVKQERGRLPGDMEQKAEEGVGDDGDEVERGCVVAARRATVSGG